MLKKTIAGIIAGAASVSILAGCAASDATQTTTSTAVETNEALIDTVESSANAEQTQETSGTTDAAESTEASQASETASQPAGVAPVENGSVKSDSIQVDIKWLWQGRKVQKTALNL